MKKLLVLMCVSILGLVACDDSSEAEYGLTPQDQCIAQGGIGCEDIYNGSSFYGSYAYPVSGGHYQGYAGNGMYRAVICGPGTQPIANGVHGIGCLPNGSMPNIPVSTYRIPMVNGAYQEVPFSCRSHNQCVSGRCEIVNPRNPGVCRR